MSESSDALPSMPRLNMNDAGRYVSLMMSAVLTSNYLNTRYHQLPH